MKAYTFNVEELIGAEDGVISLVAALDYRRQTEKGQHIDLSQWENAL